MSRYERPMMIFSERTTIFLFALCCLFGGLRCTTDSSDQHGDSPSRFSVLVFSKTDTAGYRHPSIPDGIESFREMGARHGFTVEATEDASVFTADSLNEYEAVVFLNTSEDVLNEAQQDRFERYVQSGGGFVGVHGAAATEYEWEWYGGLVGAFFDDHPEVQEATVQIADSTHPSTRHLPSSWTWTDEWYNYRTNPADSVHVLLTLDESTYEGGTMGAPHPIAWVQEYDGGRSFYTGLGHTKDGYRDAAFRQHLRGGLEWVVGR